MPSFSFTLYHQLLDVRMREIDVQVTEGSAEGMTFIVWEYLHISFGRKGGRTTAVSMILSCKILNALRSFSRLYVSVTYGIEMGHTHVRRVQYQDR